MKDYILKLFLLIVVLPITLIFYSIAMAIVFVAMGINCIVKFFRKRSDWRNVNYG